MKSDISYKFYSPKGSYFHRGWQVSIISGGATVQNNWKISNIFSQIELEAPAPFPPRVCTSTF